VPTGWAQYEIIITRWIGPVGARMLPLLCRSQVLLLPQRDAAAFARNRHLRARGRLRGGGGCDGNRHSLRECYVVLDLRVCAGIRIAHGGVFYSGNMVPHLHPRRISALDCANERTRGRTCSPRAHTQRFADGCRCAAFTCCTGNHTLRPEFVSSALVVRATTMPPTAAVAATAPVSSAATAEPPLNKGSAACCALRSHHSRTRPTGGLAGIIAARSSAPWFMRMQRSLLPPHDDARRAAGCDVPRKLNTGIQLQM
jgi:hypothetical protein